jgi:hypothetical protein
MTKGTVKQKQGDYPVGFYLQYHDTRARDSEQINSDVCAETYI